MDARSGEEALAKLREMRELQVVPPMQYFLFADEEVQPSRSLHAVTSTLLCSCYLCFCYNSGVL